MHSAYPTECTVTGTLSLVLGVSKWVGVAPLSFKRTQHGFSMRVSPAANCYGQVLSFILCTLSVSTIALDIFVNREHSFRTRTNSTRIVWVADVTTVGLVVCATAFTGLQRMKSLTACLLQLQEINAQLRIYHKITLNERSRMFTVVTSMMVTVGIVIVDYSIFMYQIMTEQEKVIISSMYIFYNVSTIVVQVVLVMFSQIATCVLTSIKTLNQCLKNLRREILVDTSYTYAKNNELRINNFISRQSINSVVDTMAYRTGQLNTSIKTMPTRIHRFALLYCSICDVLLQVNESHGVVLVALLLSLLLHLVITPYHIITNMVNRSRSDRSNLLVQLIWAGLHFSNLLLIVEPCQGTHDQMELTKQLISQMTRHTPAEYDTVLSELDRFYRHLVLNEASYAPMKMIPLNRTLIVTILGSITTYLVVMIQL